MKAILLAIDFSRDTDRIVEHGAAYARAFGAELILVHVAAPDPDFVGYKAGPQSVRDQLARHYHREHHQLQEMEERLRAESLRCRALLIQGPTVEKLVSEAHRVSAGLIVMGSHGHGVVHNLLVGSATEGVLRKAVCPVLVVPSGGKDRDEFAGE